MADARVTDSSPSSLDSKGSESKTHTKEELSSAELTCLIAIFEALHAEDADKLQKSLAAVATEGCNMHKLLHSKLHGNNPLMSARSGAFIASLKKKLSLLSVGDVKEEKHHKEDQQKTIDQKARETVKASLLTRTKKRRHLLKLYVHQTDDALAKENWRYFNKLLKAAQKDGFTEAQLLKASKSMAGTTVIMLPKAKEDAEQYESPLTTMLLATGVYTYHSFQYLSRAIVQAVHSNDSVGLQELLDEARDAGFDLQDLFANIKSPSGFNLLMLAGINGYIEVAKILLPVGANPKGVFSLLARSLHPDHHQLIKVLLAALSDIHLKNLYAELSSAVLDAYNANQMHLVAIFLNVLPREYRDDSIELTTLDQQGRSTLDYILAVKDYRGLLHLEEMFPEYLVSELFQSMTVTHTKINDRDIHGKTLLMYAEEFGDDRLRVALVSLGATSSLVDEKDAKEVSSDSTSLDARLVEYVEQIKQELSQRSNMSESMKQLLLQAQQQGITLTQLLNALADFDVDSLFVVEYDDEDADAELQKLVSDITNAVRSNDTPSRLQKLLEDAGQADFNVVDLINNIKCSAEGYLLLQFACVNNYTNAVKILLNAGAEPIEAIEVLAASRHPAHYALMEMLLGHMSNSYLAAIIMNALVIVSPNTFSDVGHLRYNQAQLNVWQALQREAHHQKHMRVWTLLCNVWPEVCDQSARFSLTDRDVFGNSLLIYMLQDRNYRGFYHLSNKDPAIMQRELFFALRVTGVDINTPDRHGVTLSTYAAHAGDKLLMNAIKNLSTDNGDIPWLPDFKDNALVLTHRPSAATVDMLIAMGIDSSAARVQAEDKKSKDDNKEVKEEKKDASQDVAPAKSETPTPTTDASASDTPKPTGYKGPGA